MTWHLFRLEDHEYLVGIVAKRYAWMCHYGRIEMCDIMQVGRLGLMKACRKFDPTRGVRFSTYAVYWVTAEIQAMSGAQAYGVYIPAYVYLKKREAGERMPGTISLDKERENSVGGNCISDNASLKNRIPARDPRPDVGLDEEQLTQTIGAVLSTLDPRHALVLRRCAQGETLDAIGNDLGVTRERVRQLREKALAKCRKHPLAKDLELYLEQA